MRTRFAAVVPVLASVVLLAACGGGSSSSKTAPPAGTATRAPLQPLAQALTFTGYVAGLLTSGTGDCRTSEASAVFQVIVIGDINGTRHSLRAVAEGYDGPGSYGLNAPRRATVNLDFGGLNAGTLVVDAGALSGSIDADLIDGERVTGTWKCTAVAIK